MTVYLLRNHVCRDLKEFPSFASLLSGSIGLNDNFQHNVN